MKQIITLFIFLFSFSTLFAQTLYTRKDSIPITKDSVVIKVGKHAGSIQWQKTLDNTNWVNLKSKTKDSIKVTSSHEAKYRAEIIDGTCNPVYSDTVSVCTNDTITKNFVCPKELGLKLISDSTDVSKGTYKYSGSSNISNFEIGKVIIDEDSGGTIRKITGINNQDNTIIVQTQQASMEDLFQNTSFKLSTEFVNPTQNLKNASLNQIEKALTDKDGFIHPVEIIYEKEDGTKLKSASIFEAKKTTQGGGLYVHKDWSNLELYNFNGTFSAENEQGVNVSYNGSTKAYIKEGYFTFDPIFKFEFEFDKPDLNVNNFLVNQGKITKFKFYTDRSLLDLKNVISYESTIGFEYGKDWTLIPDIAKGKIKFLVGGVPVWIDIKLDLKASLSVKFEQQGTTSNGFRNQNYITIGAKYENGGWDKINEFEKVTTPIVEENKQVNSNMEFSIYTNSEAKIYSIIGPTIKVGPFLEYESVVSSSNNWEQRLDFGIKAKAGYTAGIFGLGISSNLIDWDLFPKINLWKAPDKLKVVSGNNQSGAPGSPLLSPVVLKVLDSNDNPLKNTLVHLKSKMGSLIKSALGTKSALIGYDNGAELSVVSDSTGQVAVNWALADTIAVHQMEAYLRNGKDSIIEGTRDTITATACGCATKFGSFTDPRDGHVYKTIKIGTQTWMAENLAYLPYATLSSTYSYTEPCYYVYDYATYGVYYNWPAALTACPLGWHLPSDTEWTSLSDYLGGESVAGSKMKSTTSIWNSPNKGATNESCFSALPGGYRDGRGINNDGSNGYWWSSTAEEELELYARDRNLYSGHSTLHPNHFPRFVGISVRCVRDDNSTCTIPTLNSMSVSEIQSAKSISGGIITSDGGATVTFRGVCWNATGTPTITDRKTTDGNGTGTFTSTITDLIPCTTYYVRAYATNSEGTAYGEQVTFTTTADKLPCLKTKEANAVTDRSATSGGNIISEGDSPVTISGICWNTRYSNESGSHSDT